MFFKCISVNVSATVCARAFHTHDDMWTRRQPITGFIFFLLTEYKFSHIVEEISLVRWGCCSSKRKKSHCICEMPRKKNIINNKNRIFTTPDQTKFHRSTAQLHLIHSTSVLYDSLEKDEKRLSHFLQIKSLSSDCMDEATSVRREKKLISFSTLS